MMFQRRAVMVAICVLFLGTTARTEQNNDDGDKWDDMETDYYTLLGVTRNITMRALKRAYHRLALNMHPDKLGPFNSTQDLKQAEGRFIKLAQVYEILSDPTRRRRYDLHGHETRDSNDPYGG
jgi:DnaJ-class molecular chaperone